MQRTILTALAALLIALFAFGSGFVSGSKFRIRKNIHGEEIAYVRRGEHAFLQYRVADPRAAEAVLRGYLELLDGYVAETHPRLTAAFVAPDRVLTLARLASLRERGGDPRGAALYMAEARAGCAEAGWHDCSDDGILAVTREADSERRAVVADGLTAPAEAVRGAAGQKPAATP